MYWEYGEPIPSNMTCNNDETLVTSARHLATKTVIGYSRIMTRRNQEDQSWDSRSEI